MVPNLKIFIFAANFAIKQIQRSWFQNYSTIFKFQPQNPQIRHFWYQIYGFLFLNKTLQLYYSNLKVLALNMTIVLLKFQPRDIQISILGPKFKIFHSTRFAILGKFSLLKLIDSYWFKNVLPELLSLWLCAFFSSNAEILQRHLFCKSNPYFYQNFFLTDWHNIRCKNKLEISSIYLFYGFFQTEFEGDDFIYDNSFSKFHS